MSDPNPTIEWPVKPEELKLYRVHPGVSDFTQATKITSTGKLHPKGSFWAIEISVTRYELVNMVEDLARAVGMTKMEQLKLTSLFWEKFREIADTPPEF